MYGIRPHLPKTEEELKWLAENQPQLSKETLRELLKDDEEEIDLSTM